MSIISFYYVITKDLHSTSHLLAISDHRSVCHLLYDGTDSARFTSSHETFSDQDHRASTFWSNPILAILFLPAAGKSTGQTGSDQ